MKGLEQLIKTIGLSPLNVLLNMDEKGDDALGMDDAPEEAISERPEMEEKAANISIPYPVENTRHNYTVENGNPQRLNLWRQWRISLCRELL